MTKTEAQPSASNGAAVPPSPPPPSSLQARDLPSAVNSKELMEAHVARTGGKVCVCLRLHLLCRDPRSNACCAGGVQVQCRVVSACWGHCLHRTGVESAKRCVI